MLYQEFRAWSVQVHAKPWPVSRTHTRRTYTRRTHTRHKLMSTPPTKLGARWQEGRCPIHCRRENPRGV